MDASLKAIKNIVDCYYEGTVKVTLGNDDFDTVNHRYDLSVIMGLISNHIYEALNLLIPDRKEGAST